jgi:murein L,D-transpeptidase YafK
MISRLLIILLLFSSGSSAAQKHTPEEQFERQLTNSTISLKRVVDSLGIDLNRIKLFVDKSDLMLSVIVRNDTLKQYDVCLGFNPTDDKIQQGDGCTPEGTFRIIARYPHKEWSRFIYFDYPNEESRRKFNLAKAAGMIPENASIGGEIGIHGVPEGCDYLIRDRYNWTKGCISLSTNDIKELYEFVRIGTVIIIAR